MQKVELLAPAGDLEALKVAVWHGADAVYLAAQDFGMRAAPANFTFDELREGVQIAHSHNCKVYQTVNILPTNEQIADLEDFIRKSEDTGIDAIIVADVGVLMLAKRVCPELDVHISVQMGVVNYLTASELYNLGASRVVLARELTLPEIADIRLNIPDDLQIEAFVHGAICMSISGRCLISKYFVDRDANQGECAQPCRWEYDITDPRRPEIKLNVVENAVKDQEGNVISKGSYILNSKDLCLIEHIPALSEAGVYSLKIEGRAKSSFYVGSVVQAYRRAVDYYESLTEHELSNSELPNDILEDVQKISHREYTTGFYFADAKNEKGEIIEGAFNAEKSPSSYFDKGYKQEWRPIAVRLEDGWHQRGKINVGEEVEILAPVVLRNSGDYEARNCQINNTNPVTQENSESYNYDSSITQKRIIKSIFALDDDKSRKNGKLLSEPQALESSSHADQLLEFIFEKDENLAKVLPIGTFLRAKVNN